ncbi:hypothetical protein [Pedobacter caeni]|uniref:Uncharacterized protein n=1 Tax=Pedobacter caeni TaxID=288992 RepID=A0A1M5JR51_9SPHI|nr:hypothetical protein [Pedobacter caeni]SHG43024.1 hypothetical protein SAMN04488522_105480 [Pedobacter caeni]
MEKTRQLQFFMTIEDEEFFCETLRDKLPNVYFFDTCPSLESNIEKRLFSSVVESKSPFFSIVNFDLIDKATLEKSYEKHGEFYHFEQIGRAQIQFLRSKPDPFNPQNLLDGRVADSYDSENEEEKKWKSIVYSHLKKVSNKVFWYYTNLEGKPEIKVKAENGLVALPDAIQKYDGKTGFMAANGSARFVGEGVSVESLS